MVVFAGQPWGSLSARRKYVNFFKSSTMRALSISRVRLLVHSALNVARAPAAGRSPFSQARFA